MRKINNNISAAIISNIIFEPYFLPLLKSIFGISDNLEANARLIPYDEYIESEYKKLFVNSDLIIVWLNFEELFSDIWDHIYLGTVSERQAIDETVGLCEQLYADLAGYSNAHVLWFLFEDYYRQSYIAQGQVYNGLIDSINKKIRDELCENENVTFIDLKSLIAKVGIVNSYDAKGKYRWNAPYSKALIEAAVKEIHKQYLIENGITKKCLVLDCDNVLWGGILSEDGIENIHLGNSGFGRAYQDFQRFILSLYDHGVIVAICSKNDLSDVMTMFREHSEMILKEEHIACFQVNWGNKPDNIRQIAETLNIGLDSIAFVDDSSVEVEAVKAILPEVTAILYDRDTVYEQFTCFNLKSTINRAVIEKRNETYRTNQSREVLKSQYESYADYINALEIKMDIHPALPIEYARIAELTQRTNKCTNGIRYTVAQIIKRVNSKNITLYSILVADRFSDLGLVGAFEIENYTLSLFSLSCRALGREIESKMLEFIADKHQITNIQFMPTSKNEDVKTLLLKKFPNSALINCKNI